MKKITLILFLLINFNLFAQTDSISLWQCISAGIENFQVQQSLDNSNQIVDIQQQNLNANYYPSIKLNGQATYQSNAIEIDLPIPGVDMPSVPLDQYKAYLEINQLLYDGGITKTYSQILDLSVNENIVKSHLQEKEIENNIANIFFLVLLLDKQLDIIDNQLKTLNEQLDVVEAGINNNVLTPVNRDILQAQILNVEQIYEETKILRASSINILEQHTGLLFPNNSEIIFPYLSINILDSTVSPRLELLDVQSQKIDLLDIQIRATRRPQVFAFAQGGYGRPGLNLLSDDFSPYFIAGVGFSWKIYDWNTAHRNRQINAINNQQFLIQKQNTLIGINTQKQNILAQINSLKQSIEKDNQIILLQHNILKTYNSQLKNGIITSSEYVIEVNKLSQAQLTLELHLIKLEQLKFEYNNVY